MSSIAEKIYSYYETNGSLPPLEYYKPVVDRINDDNELISSLLAIYGISIVMKFREHPEWTDREKAESAAAHIQDFLVRAAS